MIRATSINAMATNRNSLNTTAIALWTPRNTGDRNKASSSGQGKYQQIPFATPRFTPRRHFGKSPSGNGNGNGNNNYHGVEVLTKLPSLYAKAQAGASSKADAENRHNADSSSHPDQLPLLYGNKTTHRQRRQQQHKEQIKPHHQPQALSPTQEETSGEPGQNDDNDNSNSRPPQKPSKFRISVGSRPHEEQQEAAEQASQRHQLRHEDLLTIPIAYFSREGSCQLQSVQIDAADARSCDLRHPDQTVAYTRAADYIRDNELMTRAKVQRIWSWIDAIDQAADGAAAGGGLFVYDQTARWFVAPPAPPPDATQ